ncbi:hypothetical protein BSIN_3731 [Burkholderia singularis]|uniref:Uncharacterized protein n=1 Tax=Burkholderia singularis TaxID=1503053 RepID=A0A238H5T2_9BURK|nr:hypothetical protein BSIN_3731 [Burkholderia singularis]
MGATRWNVLACIHSPDWQAAAFAAAVHFSCRKSLDARHCGAPPE